MGGVLRKLEELWVSKLQIIKGVDEKAARDSALKASDDGSKIKEKKKRKKKKKDKEVKIPQMDGLTKSDDSSDEGDGLDDADDDEDDEDDDESDELDPDGDEYDEGVEQEPLAVETTSLTRTPVICLRLTT